MGDAAFVIIFECGSKLGHLLRAYSVVVVVEDVLAISRQGSLDFGSQYQGIAAVGQRTP